MSCCCNTNPCSCSPQPANCCTQAVESVEYTFENQGLSGVGVFDNDTNYLVGFRTLVSESASLTITLNAPDKTIVFDFDDAQLIADIPDATTAQRGILETATDPEAVAKALNNKILTPSNLAALGSTTSFAGLVELATNAETITGTSTTLATTPAGVAAAAALYKTATWADAATRAAATPAFVGQIGVQQDTAVPWVATGAGVGDFNDALLVLGNTSNAISTVNTTIDITSGSVFLFNSSDFSGMFSFSSDVTFQPGFQITMASDLDIQGGSVLISGVAIPANSVLITAGAGALSSALISNFLSTANSDGGWTNFTNSMVRKTCDCNTVTLPELAQIVDTLIQTLGSSVQIPIP